MSRLRAFLIEHEGMELKPYRCTKGKLTIAAGRNLEDRGILQSEADLMLTNDIAYATGVARMAFGGFDSLNDARQAVLISMAHQMGPAGLRGFKQMIKALWTGDWEAAARAMLDSKWAREDTPQRAAHHAQMMRSGAWPGPTVVA